MKKIATFLFILFSLEALAQDHSKDSSHTKEEKKFIALPIVISTPETKLGLGTIGTYLFKPHGDTSVRTSNIQAGVLYTLRKQILIECGGNIYSPGERYIFRWYGSFTRFPDRFWGVGNNTPNSNEELYTFSEFYFYPQLTRKIYKQWFVGITYEYQNIIKNKYDTSGIFVKDPKNPGRGRVVGRDGGLASGIGPIITWDNRNSAFSPDKGSYFQLTYTQYNRIVGSIFNFSKFTMDARKYIKSFSKNVWASQFYAEFNRGEVPFRNLAFIGGSNQMRGYYLGRYRDKDLIVLQTEYRMPVWKRFGIVGFGGLGEVSDKINHFSLNGIKYSLGGGIRFAIKPKEKLNIRLDYGIGYHSSGAYLYFTEAF